MADARQRLSRHPARFGATAAAVLLLAASLASAGPYSDLIVFGDSLSDVGNTQYTTSNGFGGLFAPDTPGDAYFFGRFSNGLVWTEWLSSGLGLGTIYAERDEDAPGNRDNFAFGGARTEGTDFLTDIYIDDLQSQISNFVDNRMGDPNALYTMLIGANDLFQIDTGETAQEQLDYVIDATIRVRGALQSLYDTGARNFLVLNLPLLGLTPEYSSAPEGAQYWNDLTIDYNINLDIDLNIFEFTNPDATVFRLDTEALLTDLVDNAADRGFTNTTDSAAPGLEPGDNGYDQSLIVSNPDEYLFYDGVHPTAAVHRLLGYAAMRAVLPAGDYNRDGEVTGADYLVWRNAYGSTQFLTADGNGDAIVDAADYTIWRNSYNATLASTASLASATGFVAPEPSSAALLFGVVGLGAGSRRRA